MEIKDIPTMGGYTNNPTTKEEIVNTFGFMRYEILAKSDEHVGFVPAAAFMQKGTSAILIFDGYAFVGQSIDLGGAYNDFTSIVVEAKSGTSSTEFFTIPTNILKKEIIGSGSHGVWVGLKSDVGNGMLKCAGGSIINGKMLEGDSDGRINKIWGII